MNLSPLRFLPPHRPSGGAKILGGGQKNFRALRAQFCPLLFQKLSAPVKKEIIVWLKKGKLNVPIKTLSIVYMLITRQC